MPVIDASVSTSKAFSKLGRAKTGAIVSFSLIRTKLFSCSSPHLKHPFFTQSVSGVAIELKFLITSGKMWQAHENFEHRELILD